MRVRWFGRHEVASFVAAAWPLLAADPVRNSDGLTVLDRICRSRPSADVAAQLTVHDGDAPAGALLRTHGRPALVSAIRPEHAQLVDAALAERDPDLPGVTGPAEVVEALAAAHTARTGTAARVDLRMRLFALGTPAPVAGVDGAARVATHADADLLTEWLAEFGREATRQLRDPCPPRERVLRSLAGGDRMLLWECAGRPVALAVAQRQVAGMTRIGPVYTPPADRRRGFGAAVTAAAARRALDDGSRHVVLFVDQTNPTTNRLYPTLGFRPVHEGLELSYHPR